MLTPAEQLFLEFANRARLDPLGEAARYGLADLNDPDPTNPDSDPPPDTITAEVKQPLAHNALLGQAARDHSLDMIARDYFQHVSPDGVRPADRIADSGYDAARTGENIALSGSSEEVDLDAAIATGIGPNAKHHEGLFLSSGHRYGLLFDAFRETGVAQEGGPYSHGSQTFQVSMVTQKFAEPADGGVFLTGVAYDDVDADGFYSIGEGVGGLLVSAGGESTTTAASGGYALALPAGTGAVDVTFDWNGTALAASVDLSAGNVKLDVVGGVRLLSSGDLVLGDGVIEAGLLGAGDLSMTGNAEDNLLFVGRGDNTIDGGGGENLAVFTGDRADYTVTQSGDTVTVADSRDGLERDGTNTLTGVSVLRFADGDHAPDGTPLADEPEEPEDPPEPDEPDDGDDDGDEPEEPDEPDEPEEPEDPDDGDEPDEEAEPDEGDDPEEPEEPDEGDPADGDDPDEPETPEEEEDAPETHLVTGMVTDPAGNPIALAGVYFTPAGHDESVGGTMTNDDGLFGFEMPDGASGRFDLEAQYAPSHDPQISTADALDVLRMAVGLEPSWGPASPEAFIAADVDRDGRVTTGDALETLRMAVGMDSEHGPEWVFLDAAADLSDIGRESVVYDTGVEIGGLSADLDVSVSGILLGSLREFG